jgi:hypothetical protein
MEIIPRHSSSQSDRMPVRADGWKGGGRTTKPDPTHDRSRQSGASFAPEPLSPPARQGFTLKPVGGDWTTWWPWRGAYTRSHPELGREIPQRPWYCVSRHGRVGRRQVFQSPPPYAPPAHPMRRKRLGLGGPGRHTYQRGVEQPGSSSGS